MQSQRNGMKDDNDIKLPLAYIQKLQNTAEVKALASNEMALTIKGVVRGKEIVVSIKKVICTTS